MNEEIETDGLARKILAILKADQDALHGRGKMSESYESYPMFSAPELEPMALLWLKRHYLVDVHRKGLVWEQRGRRIADMQPAEIGTWINQETVILFNPKFQQQAGVSGVAERLLEIAAIAVAAANNITKKGHV